LLRMDTSICHNAHLGESMGQHRALYQIGGISPGQKNDFTTDSAVGQGPRLPFRVKSGKPQIEHMFSALLPIGDILDTTDTHRALPKPPPR